MSEKKKKIIYLVYGIIQSALLVVCGICLIAACLAIYDGGDGTFSREAVTSQFKKILIPVIICIVGIVAGAVLTLIYPRKTKKLKGDTDIAVTIKRLSARVDMKKCPSEITKLIQREQKFRLALTIAATVICVLLTIPCLIYLFDLSHFDDIGKGLTEDIIMAMLLILPAAAEGLLASAAVTFACHDSYKRELILVKEAIKTAPLQGKAKVTPETDQSKGYKLWIIRGAVFLIAIVFIVIGIFNDGMNDVLQKAIRICTECIGLG